MIDIIKSNRLIAEFMGIRTKVYSDTPTITHYNFNNNMLTPNLMRYHTSWDWLMPVVEKIEMLSTTGKLPEFFVMYDDREEFKGWYWSVEVPKKFKKECESRDVCKINATYKAVIAFIQWYELNQTKS